MSEYLTKDDVLKGIKQFMDGQSKVTQADKSNALRELMSRANMQVKIQPQNARTAPPATQG
jgi:hypothetical protein